MPASWTEMCGRRHVRSGLWMPTITAVTRNPAFAARLRAEHKPPNVVTVACLRKLVTILNAIVARDQLWAPPPQPA